jgi:predicted nucleic acid-binding protein
MNVFIDTSAFISLLQPDDDNHPAASSVWQFLIDKDQNLFTTNYVLVETFAVLQRKFGLHVIRELQESVIPLLNVHWVSPEIHDAAIGLVLGFNRRQLSLVDCTSFETMRRLGIRKAFAFDPHFTEQGFESLPETE